MCPRLVEMYIYRLKPTRNYSFVLLCVGVQRSRKARAMCHLPLTPQRLMITIDRQSRKLRLSSRPSLNSWS